MNKDDKNIDRILRDKFEGFGKNPSPDLWSKIEKEVNKKSKEKIPFSYLLFSLTFCGLFIASLVYIGFNNKNIANEKKQSLNNKNESPEDLNKNKKENDNAGIITNKNFNLRFKENTSPENNTASGNKSSNMEPTNLKNEKTIVSDRNNEISLIVDKEILKENNKIKQKSKERKKHSWDASLNENKNNKNFDVTALIDDNKTKENFGKLKKNNNNTSRNNYSDENITSDKSHVNTSPDENNPNKLALINKNNIYIDNNEANKNISSDKNNLNESALTNKNNASGDNDKADQNITSNKGGQMNISSDKSNTNSLPNNSYSFNKNKNQESNKDSSNQVGRTPDKTNLNRPTEDAISSMQPNVSKIFKDTISKNISISIESVKTSLTEENSDSTTATFLNTAKNNQTEDSKKEKKKSRKENFSLSIYLSPEKMTNCKDCYLSDSYKSKLNYSEGLKFNYQFSNKVSVSVGLSVLDLRNKFSYTNSTKVLTQTDTIYDTSGTVINYVYHYKNIDKNINFSNHYIYLGIPISVNYKFGEKKLYLSATIGVTPLYLVGSKETIYNIGDSLATPVNDYLRRFNFQLMAGLGLNYQFSEKINLFIEPTIKYFTSKTHKRRDYGSTRPLLIGIQTGLSLKF